MRNALIPATAAFVLAAATMPVAAFDQDDDSFVLRLSAEAAVDLDTPTVYLQADINLNSDRWTGMRSVLDAVSALAPDAEWRIVGAGGDINGRGAPAQTTLAARIDEAELDGLASRVEAASGPDIVITFQRISVAPALADIEATKAELRERIYREAATELRRIQAVFPDRPLRIGTVDFTYPRLEDCADQGPDCGAAPIEEGYLRAEAHVVLVAADGTD